MNDTDMGMNTANALNALNMGHDVRRKAWEPHVVIRKLKARIGPHEGQDVTKVSNKGGVFVPFIWLDQDIYATDWEIA